MKHLLSCLTATFSFAFLMNGCGGGGSNSSQRPATPAINWATPAAITYGTPLSSAQLDATANHPGTFTYSPAAGTVLSAGTQTLNAAFTPNDPATVAAVTAKNSLNELMRRSPLAQREGDRRARQT